MECVNEYEKDIQFPIFPLKPEYAIKFFENLKKKLKCPHNIQTLTNLDYTTLIRGLSNWATEIFHVREWPIVVSYINIEKCLKNLFLGKVKLFWSPLLCSHCKWCIGWKQALIEYWSLVWKVLGLTLNYCVIFWFTSVENFSQAQTV